jgi:hypothetical protein
MLSCAELEGISTNSLIIPCLAAKFAEFGRNLKISSAICEDSLYFSLFREKAPAVRAVMTTK